MDREWYVSYNEIKKQIEETKFLVVGVVSYLKSVSVNAYIIITLITIDTKLTLGYSNYNIIINI